MDKDGLLKKHKTYDAMIDRWTFWDAAYDGDKDFIDLVIKRNTRESESNFKERKDEATVFNYPGSVVDLFNFYLTEKPATRDLGRLADNPLWKAFKKDCDLYGTNFNTFINEAQKTASIFGAIGILVDKPSFEAENRQQEVEKGIYPYCSAYTLNNIYDWKHERNPETNRPELVYIKLADFDGRYFLWWKHKWEVWEIQKDEKTGKETVVLIRTGENRLGMIPFFWMINIKNQKNPYIGVSDIKTISRIAAGITRNLSCGEEIIKYAGFPQARRPMAREGEEEQNDTAGVTAILEFDPELGEAGKPDWLESEVEEPIEAILNWIERKIDEIFQNAHLSGVHAQERSSEARSGIALRYEFQQLGSVLSKKSDNMVEAELMIIWLWLKWQNDTGLFDGISIRRSKDFSVDDLAQNIENSLKAMTAVVSETFKKETQKQIVRQILIEVSDEERRIINDEIDSHTFNK